MKSINFIIRCGKYHNGEPFMYTYLERGKESRLYNAYSKC